MIWVNHDESPLLARIVELRAFTGTAKEVDHIGDPLTELVYERNRGRKP